MAKTSSAKLVQHARIVADLTKLMLDTGWMPCGEPVTGGVRVGYRTPRRRFQRGDWFCTIGVKTVSFYQRMGSYGRSVGGFQNADSSDLDRIQYLIDQVAK